MNNNNLAVVHPDAKIGQNVVIEPFAYVANNVVIGDNCWIGPHAVIMSGSRIGNNCKIFPGAVVGGAPQDLKYDGEDSIVELGNNVIVREYCTLNRGTKASQVTKIGNNCLLMAYVHVAHDCLIGDYSILANNVNLAGHIEIGKNAVLGGLTAVHQFVKIGEHSMIGGGSLVRKDVPPYVKAAREPLSYVGINGVGLRRRQFSAEQITTIQEIYRLIFVRGNNTTQAIKAIESQIPPSSERDLILDFMQQSKRGIMRGLK
jgi:UDP-N-acetylglucosamine acyltransferase